MGVKGRVSTHTLLGIRSGEGSLLPKRNLSPYAEMPSFSSYLLASGSESLLRLCDLRQATQVLYVLGLLIYELEISIILSSRCCEDYMS